MTTFISHRTRVEVPEFRLFFACVPDDGTGSGYSFPCDAAGNVDRAALHPAALANLEKCYSDLLPVSAPTVVDSSYHYYEPAQIRCDCRRAVSLDDAVVNSCPCGREYNGFGQLLAPREQWGEETGETAADILLGYDPERI